MCNGHEWCVITNCDDEGIMKLSAVAKRSSCARDPDEHNYQEQLVHLANGCYSNVQLFLVQ